MCVSVATRDASIDNCGELAALLGTGIAAIPWCEGIDLSDPTIVIHESTCLCGVDFHAVAEQLGLVAFRPAYEDGDPMEWGMVPEDEVRALLTAGKDG